MSYISTLCVIFVDTLSTLFCVLLLDGQSVKAVPGGIYSIDAISKPVNCNAFGAFDHWATTMCSESVVLNLCLWIHVAEKGRSTNLWLRRHTRMPKVGEATLFGNCTVHDHGRNTALQMTK